MKELIHCLFKYHLSGFKWYRKLIGGKWYYIWPRGLSMGCFWAQQEIKSCQSETLKFEDHGNKEK